MASEYHWRDGVVLRCQAWNAQDRVLGELKAIDVVEHAHVEGGGGGAFFLVAAHVDVVVIVAAVGETVNDPGIAVKCKDDGTVLGKDGVEFFVGEAVRVFRLWLQSHQVDRVDEADLDVGNLGAEKRDCGQRLDGGHIAAACHHDVGISIVVGSPFPDAYAGGAVSNGFIHGEPLRTGLFSGDDEVDVVAAAQAVVGDGEQCVGIGRAGRCGPRRPFY